MNRIIVIAGDLASGKSTLADNLKEHLHFLCLKKDVYKELICDEIGFANRDENLKISHLTMSLLFLTIQQAMEENIDVIIEANFHFNELETIISLISRFHYRSLFLNLSGDTEVLYQRFLERVPTRHPAHLSGNLQDSFLSFKQYIDKSREEIKRFSFHHIDTTNNDTLLTFHQVLEIIQQTGFENGK